jgi:hypothetical protein
LRVVDVLTPSAPFEVGFYDELHYASGVAVDGEYAYVADSSAGLFILRYRDCGPPPAPNLLSPPHAEGTDDATPAFGWEAQVGATAYRIEVDDDVRFSSPVVSEETVNTSFTPGSALPLGTYYWRVQSSNDCGSGVWSPTWSFICASPRYLYLPLVLRND